ncbi:MAG: hypothetical protein ACK5XN_32720, partial [Bacteroidota bacterium]
YRSTTNLAGFDNVGEKTKDYNDIFAMVLCASFTSAEAALTSGLRTKHCRECTCEIYAKT